MIDTKHRAITLISYATLVAALAIIGYFAYFLLSDFNPIILYDETGEEIKYNKEEQSFYGVLIAGDSNKLKRGEVHYLEMNYCKTTNAKVEVEKHLVDGIFIQINDVDENGNYIRGAGTLKKGCDQELKIPFYLSEKVPLGEYRLRNKIDYKYSPIHTETRYIYSEIFEVVE